VQRASKQCVVLRNSWARILGARVVVVVVLRNASYQGASEEPTTVLGLVERCATDVLGFGEKVTAGAENLATRRDILSAQRATILRRAAAPTGAAGAAWRRAAPP
jgi:hypothetical protein